MIASFRVNTIKTLAVFTGLATTILFSLIAIYGFGDYGFALFIVLPFVSGFISVVVYSWPQQRSMKECVSIGFLTIGMAGFVLFIFAIEGLICLVMASPLLIFLCWLGSISGFWLQQWRHSRKLLMILPIWLIIPATMVVENTHPLPYPEYAVTSHVLIDATTEEVWENVIEFPEIGKPDEWLFRAGIAYPLNARIEGEGDGAIRYCNFTTGSFVEPITTWKVNEVLAFDVTEQPAPMQELSFLAIHPPHLNGHFQSSRGQFTLTKVSANRTLLTGTTWYTYRIRPQFYWHLWSDYIIHKIHLRVLSHIQHQSEN
ncbi:MAG: hypothetical protein WD077_15955 [Bacteroidia bacterium]